MTLLVFPVAAQVSRVTGKNCGFLGLNCTGGENIKNSILPVFANIFTAGITILGSVAAIFILYAGFKYITSGGDEQKSRTAKLQILFAFVGIIIAVTASIIKAAIVTLGEGRPDVAAGAIGRILNNVGIFATSLVGIIAVIFLIYAGFKYIASTGDPEAGATAKRQIIYAIIGIIIVITAFTIANASILVGEKNPDAAAAKITPVLISAMFLD